jgi:hypothetical protein
MCAQHLQASHSLRQLGNVGIFVAQQVSTTRPATDTQAKLILQDPRAWDQAQTPALKGSNEISPLSSGQLDAATAQQTWQAVQLTSDEVAEKLSQLRTVNASNQKANQKIQALQVESTNLRQQVQHHESQSWQQPALLATAVLAVGLTWLWLSERRQRQRVQEDMLLFHDADNSVLAMPEGPSLNFAEPEPEQPKIQDLISDPISDAILPEDLLPYAKANPVPSPTPAPVFTKPKALVKPIVQKEVASWWKLGKRKSATFVNSVDAYNSTSARSSGHLYAQSTQIEPYDELAELDQFEVLAEQNGYDHASAQVELLAQTRIKPASSEDAMGHLLEVRMAVRALCALEKTDAATKLLMQHIEAVPNTCAWAYVEYLHLCLLLGRRDDFEAMRKRYRLQFNRLAPYWMEPNAAVQALETYDRPMSELCAAWPTQEQAKTLITTWLLGNLHSRRLFQLVAYHDLMDLYEMFEFYDESPLNNPEFVPTVSLLDLDYEFAVEVTLEAQSDQDALRAIPTVKTGDFAVDVNLTQYPTEPGSLTAIVEPSKPASLPSRP